MPAFIYVKGALAQKDHRGLPFAGEIN